MNQRYHSKDIPSLKGKKIFFDTNVLLYIFWPLGSNQKFVNNYSSIFVSLLNAKNEMIIDQTIISELVNTALRIEYDKQLKIKAVMAEKYPFKKFRNSEEGKQAQESIFNEINKLLNYFSVNGKSFTKNEIEAILKIDSLDFSDKLILEICKENGYILLSNDKDFLTTDIDILRY